MSILIIFLAVILGVIIFLTLLFLILKNKFTNFLKSIGYTNLNALKDEIKKGEIESKTNHGIYYYN